MLVHPDAEHDQLLVRLGSAPIVETTHLLVKRSFELTAINVVLYPAFLCAHLSGFVDHCISFGLRLLILLSPLFHLAAQIRPPDDPLQNHLNQEVWQSF